MNDIIKEWFIELYKGAIKDARATIANERIWANGSDPEAAEIHEGNIRLQEEYIEELENRIAELEG